MVLKDRNEGSIASTFGYGYFSACHSLMFSLRTCWRSKMIFDVHRHLGELPFNFGGRIISLL